MDIPFKILIVEDHPLTRMGIKLSINRNFPNCEIVGETKSNKEALDFLPKCPDLDLVILDITLTDGSSLPTAKFLKQTMPTTKLLVCSMSSSRSDIIKFVELGADGFISKFSNESELAEAIPAVLNNETYYGKEITNIINSVSNADSPVCLTEREIEIIQMCANGKRVKVIAQELGISKRTVESHKSNIFNKLGVKNTTEVVKYAIEKGIVSL